MACSKRAVGPVAVTELQLVPLKTQVSESSPVELLVLPPNITTRPEVASPAIAWPKRADGTVPVMVVQEPLRPSQSQSSLSGALWLEELRPPKRSTWLVSPTSAMAERWRGLGLRVVVT